MRMAIAAILVTTQLGGCSLLFVKKAPHHVPPGAWASCTESVVFPVIDAIYGTASVIGAVGIGTSAADEEDAQQVAGPVYGLIGLAYLYSAYVGFRETSRCSKIHSQAEAAGVYGPQPYYQPQPYPYPYPPQPYPPQPQPQPQPPPAQPVPPQP